MFDDFEKRQKQFDKNFNFLFRFVMGMIVVAFICILIYWGFIAFVALKIVDFAGHADPKEIAHSVGEVVKSFNEGASK